VRAGRIRVRHESPASRAARTPTQTMAQHEPTAGHAPSGVAGFDAATLDALLDFGGAPAAIAVAPPAAGAGARERAPVTHHVIQLEHGAIPITLVGDRVPGTIAYVTYEVRMTQLRPARQGLLRSGYDPDRDEGLPALMRSIESTGQPFHPLVVWPTRDTVAIEQETAPVFEVRLGLRVYWALRRLGRPTAVIRIPDVENPGQLLLFALAEQDVRRSLSLLDRCDTARTLHRVYGYPQHVIGISMGQHPASAQSCVSRLIMAADQPDLIRHYLATDSLTIAHVQLLNDRIPDLPTRELVARYVVQEAMSSHRLRGLINRMELLPGTGSAIQLLAPPDEEPDGHIRLLDAGGSTVDTGAPAERPPTAYWMRGAPLSANPMRVATLAKKRQIAIETSGEQVLVELDGLGSRRLYHEYAAERRGWVPLEVLERELLADLEAVQRSLAARGLLTDAGLIQAVQVVDATPDSATHAAARA
jgi:hypothetical protein